MKRKIKWFNAFTAWVLIMAIVVTSGATLALAETTDESGTATEAVLKSPAEVMESSIPEPTTTTSESSTVESVEPEPESSEPEEVIEETVESVEPEAPEATTDSTTDEVTDMVPKMQQADSVGPMAAVTDSDFSVENTVPGGDLSNVEFDDATGVLKLGGVDKTYRVSMAATAGATTTHRIEVIDQNVTVILNGVRIDTGTGSAMNIANGASATVDLVGDNKLTTSKQDSAGLQTHNDPDSLTITSNSDGNGGFEGSLVAKNSHGDAWGAGIGGRDYGSVTVTIKSGTVTGISRSGAGIGGGAGGTGTVIIESGTVTGSSHGGAGIGGGIGGIGNVTIESGIVTGSSDFGVGIGGGAGGSATVTIKSGTVTGSSRGEVGIGHDSHAPTGSVTITGGSVKAVNDSISPAPKNDTGGFVALYVADGKDFDPAQGVGVKVTTGSVEKNFEIKEKHKKIDGTDDPNFYLYLSKESPNDEHTVKIGNNQYKIKWEDNKFIYQNQYGDFLVDVVPNTGIIGFDRNSNTLSLGTEGATYTVRMASSEPDAVTDHRIVVSKENVKVTLNNVNINADRGAAMLISSGASAIVDLVGTNKLITSNRDSAALQTQNAADLLTITSASDVEGGYVGSLVAKNSHDNANGAGIGGGNGESATVTINSGTVTGSSADAGAGIGGGNSGTGTVTINSGTVTGSSEKAGAGIGGGSGGEGTVTIKSGEVIGGGRLGAGIGGGYRETGTVTINSGTVTGSSGSNGAGIGGGQNGTGTVLIESGTVTGNSAGAGAGIGGGTSGVGTVTIKSGVVTGSSGSNGAGIGGGTSEVGTVTIESGTVTGSSVNGAGIGDGSFATGLGAITITGGSVKAVGGGGNDSISPRPKDGATPNSNELALYVADGTDFVPANGVKVTTGNVEKDFKISEKHKNTDGTLDNNFYLYLPQKTHVISELETDPYTIQWDSVNGKFARIIGDFAIDHMNGATYENNVLKLGGQGQTYKVSMRPGKTETATNRIVVDNTGVNVQLNSVQIHSTTNAPILITDTASATVDLVGDNKLITSHENFAGLQTHEASNSLTITSASDGNGGYAGSLDARNANEGAYGAGIGGGSGGSASVTIKSGTVTGIGGSGGLCHGAGIGGGWNGTGTVTIESGTVTGRSGNGAGIGGGQNGTGTVIIESGTVTGNSGNGAGIGGGREGGGTVTINSGTVTGMGSGGAGIGGGWNGTGTVTIKSSTVTGSSYSGVGIGSNIAGGSVTITGGSVKATKVTGQNEVSGTAAISPKPTQDEAGTIPVEEYQASATNFDPASGGKVLVGGVDFKVPAKHKDDNDLYLYLTYQDAGNNEDKHVVKISDVESYIEWKEELPEATNPSRFIQAETYTLTIPTETIELNDTTNVTKDVSLTNNFAGVKAYDKTVTADVDRTKLEQSGPAGNEIYKLKLMENNQTLSVLSEVRFNKLTAPFDDPATKLGQVTLTPPKDPSDNTPRAGNYQGTINFKAESITATP